VSHITKGTYIVLTALHCTALQALAALEAARQQLAAADAHVRNYSRTTAFSPAEYKAKSDRLAMVSSVLVCAEQRESREGNQERKQQTRS
jgi:hypothetical protein